jgi:hypothetical protein
MGQSVTITAQVSGSAPTGSVLFKVFQYEYCTVTLSGGNATCRVPEDAGKGWIVEGDNQVCALYSGDENNDSGVGCMTQVTRVAQTALTLESSVNPAWGGETVTFTAHIRGAPQPFNPTGGVRFRLGATWPLGCESQSIAMQNEIDGIATCSVANPRETLGPGFPAPVTAFYFGDVNNTIAGADVMQDVRVFTPTVGVSVSPTPARAGQPVAITATVNGLSAPLIPAPTGVINFSRNGFPIGTCYLVPMAGAVAACPFVSYEVGTATFSAFYSGDINNYGASGQATHTTVAIPAGRSDFNRDGHPDIVWSNTATGATYLWGMGGNPPSIAQDYFIAAIDPSWKVQGIADFNGDGNPDLVWRNTATGNCYVWYMSGAAFLGDAFLFALPPEWVIQGLADFNADGKPDFLMRNVVSGNAFAWFFNNDAAIGDQFLFGIDPSWKVEQVGHLNADTQPDLLFRSTASGLAFAWFTNWDGTALTLAGSTPPIFSIDPAWEIVQVEDWNGDGNPDLLFRNANTGVVFVWYLNADASLGAGSDYVIQIDPSWEIVPRR